MFSGKDRLTDIVSQNDRAKQVLEQYNMFCDGCPGMEYATLAEAAEAHDVSLEELLKKLNEEI